MLRLWNNKPVCENCFKEEFERYDDDDGETLVSWYELPKITYEMVYLYDEDER